MFDDIFNLYWDDKNRYCINNKQVRTRELVLYMLNRTQQIFNWHGLPDTIPQHNLEFMLQTCGNLCITDVTEIPDGRGEKGLYAFWGGLGGELNAYYEPTIYTVANPYLQYNKELTIGTDCIRIRNDKSGIGLIPLFVKYASMQNENEISLNMLAINYRIDNLISADNDRTFESAKEFLNDIIDGRFGAISSNEFFEGIRNDKVGGSTKNIKDLIEYEQYIKASWFNEIGLNSNFNMKRERLTEAETDLTDDALIPLVDNMLSWREKACEDIKELYGDRYDLENLSVTLNPIWDLDKMYISSIPEALTEEREEEISERSEDITDEMELENDNNGDNISDIANNVSDNSDSIDTTEHGEQDEETQETEDTETAEETEETDPETVETTLEEIQNTVEEIKDIIEEVTNDVSEDEEIKTE